MSDEKDEFINTEEPIQVSEEELQMLMEASEEIDRGEGLVSHEEALLYIDKIKGRIKSRKSQRGLLKVGS